jgi:hypothetical protein
VPTHTVSAIEQLPPSVLFPCRAPAGWVVEPATAADGGRRHSKKRLVQDEITARAEIRALAAKLFTDAVADGLLASEALDVVVREPTYLSARDHYNRVCDASGNAWRQRTLRGTFPMKLWLLNRSLRRLLERGLSIENISVPAIRRVQTLPPSIPASVPLAKRKENPLWFIGDPLLPDAVIRGMLASHRAYAAAAIQDGLIYSRRWGMPIILPIAEIWVDEAKRYLALLASIPEAKVPLKDVPSEDRAELADAIAAQRSLLADLRDTAA